MHICSLRVREWVNHHSQLSSVFTWFQLQSSGWKKASFPTCTPTVAVCTIVWSHREDHRELHIFPTPSKYTRPTRICQLLFILTYFQVVAFCINSILHNCFLEWRVGRLPSMALVHDNWNPDRVYEKLIFGYGIK